MNDERREHQRVQSINLVSVGAWHREWNTSLTGLAVTVEVSLGGAQVELNEPYPLHTVFQLDLALEDEIIRVQGEVRHIEALEDERYRAGLQFIDLDPAAAERLRAHIEAHGPRF